MDLLPLLPDSIGMILRTEDYGMPDRGVHPCMKINPSEGKHLATGRSRRIIPQTHALFPSFEGFEAPTEHSTPHRASLPGLTSTWLHHRDVVRLRDKIVLDDEC
uniref:Uncharacterized protein n=1 Tax=Bionectria ochroleuca TaxID=29856 RepID=A0A8H7KDQ9_BIOOC